MRAGVIEQVGSPIEMYERPASKFVMDFIGAVNYITGTVKAHEGETYLVETQLAGTPLQCSGPDGLSTGAEVLLAVRPQSIDVHKTPPTNRANVWGATVRAGAYFGDRREYRLAVGSQTLRVYTPPTQILSEGDHVSIEMNPIGVSILTDAEPGVEALKQSVAS